MDAFFGGSGLLLAEAEVPERLSYVQWIAEILGSLGLLAIVLGVAVLAGACVVVARSRSPAVVAAYLVFIPLPLILAVFAAAKNTLGAFAVLSSDDPNWFEPAVAQCLGEGAVFIMCGILATMPAYLVTAIGLFRGTVQANQAVGVGHAPRA
jgi:hypothetical protein